MSIYEAVTVMARTERTENTILPQSARKQCKSNSDGDEKCQEPGQVFRGGDPGWGQISEVQQAKVQKGQDKNHGWVLAVN